MSKSEDQKMAALIKKNAAKAAKLKSARRRGDDTLPPDPTEEDLERRNFFSEMQKREF